MTHWPLHTADQCRVCRIGAIWINTAVWKLTPLLLPDRASGEARTIIVQDHCHLVGKIRCDGRRIVSDRNVADDLTSTMLSLLTIPLLPMALVPHEPVEYLME